MPATESLECVVVSGPDALGEGPVWLADAGILRRIDIERPAIVEFNPVTRRERQRATGAPVGFALSTASGGIVAGVGREVMVATDLEAPFTSLAEVEPDAAANRFNDAICDPVGRLWAGTISRVGPGGAALHRLEAGGRPEVALAGLTIANGLDWDADATRLYFIDTATSRIDAIDFDLDRGELGRRRPFATIDAADGAPDGLCVDADGGVWVALYGGGAIRRYTPDGRLDRHLPVPASNPTSLAFGGPSLDDLYVTTSRLGMSAEQLAMEPAAGALLRLRPGVQGRPGWAFGSS